MGVANMFDPYRDRMVVAELDSTMPVRTPSTSSCTTRSPNPNPTTMRSATLVANPRARRVVVYTWNFHPDLIASARSMVRTATCRRRFPPASWSPRWRPCMPARGHQRPAAAARSAVGLDWPGRGEGLSDRESEILALITQGKSNAEVATLTYLSPNT